MASNNSSGNNRSRSNGSRNSSSRSNTSRTRGSGSNNKKMPNKNTKAYARMRQQEREEAKTPPENRKEIYIIVFFAINLILILGTYGVCGKVGKAVSGFFFGLFGSVFFVLPVFIFITFCFLMANGPKPKLIKKIIWGTVFFMTIAFMCQLFVGTKGVGVKELYMDGYSDHRGGGVIFGGLLCILAKLLSRVGALIIAILFMIISIIEVTNVRLSEVFRKLFSFNFTDINRADEDYEYEDEYDDDYDDEDIIARKIRDRDILGSIRVLDDEGKSAASKKKKERKKTNVIVPEEEVHELTSKNVPRDFFDEPEEPEITSQRGKQSKKKRPEGPVENVYPVKPSFLDDPAFAGAGDMDFPIRTANDTAFDAAGSGAVGGNVTGDDISGSGVAGAMVTGDNVVRERPQKRKQAPVNEEYAQPAATAATPENTEKVTKDDTQKATQEIGSEIEKQAPIKKKYVFPPMSLLKSGGRVAFNRSGDTAVRETAITLKSTLESFGVNVTITNCSVGPSITRYELQPEQGVRVNKILSLENDIKLALAATDIRIEAPIPGKSSIGIEIPNKENQMVYFRDLIDNDAFARFKSNVAFAVGKDISGQIIIHDIAKMPHLLIAGSTGSGKSVCINTLIMSILYKSSPENVRMIMVDPKMVELTAYNGIPHLLIPVVTDPKKAAGALNWAVDEMTKRYQLFANYNVRNIEGFNKKVKEQGPNEDPMFKHMYQLIVIVDELADLMMVAHKEVEDSIVRLSQLARAAGIHLVIATQRPSVDVITGLIKANVPSRIAFAVSSGVDSRTIIDMVGAEKLLGKGDMLFYPAGYTKPVRVQGAFIDDDEVVAVAEFIKEHYGETTYDETISKSIESSNVGGAIDSGGGSSDDNSRYDEYFEDAARFVIDKDKASIGYLQRMLRIGFNRAARIMDQLEEFGVVGPEEGTKPRRILMTMSEFEDRLDSME